MHTIVIATDFSDASRNASLYGTALGKLLDAKIILFSAYQLPHQMPALNVDVSEYGVLKDTEQKLEDEAAHIRRHNKVIIEIVCEHGDSETAINSIAKEKQADFIIVGMKGRGKNLRKVLGSTATALAQSTKVPLIIVPDKTEFAVPKTIVVASDKNADTDFNSSKPLRAIIELFDSKIFIVKVITNASEERFEIVKSLPVADSAIQLPDANFEYPVDSDISHALNSFIEKNNVDMLVMLPHRHDWAEKLFRKSETKDMIFHTHVPLLILPEQN